MNPSTDYSIEHAEVCVEPNLVLVRIHGRLGSEQIPQMTGFMKQIQEQHGRLFLLVDLREGEHLPSAMRRTLAQAMIDFDPAALGVFGATVEQRGSHALLMGALTGMSGRRPNTAYFPTEAEAREWLGVERQRLLGS